jgi:Carboxypeptidase regulatory-like domain
MMSVVVGAALSAVVGVGLAAGQNSQKDVPPPAQVQETLAGVDLVVTDTNGAVIQNARVTLVNVPFAKIEGVTNASGHLSLSRLRPGSYRVTVSSPYFMSEQTTIRVPQEGIMTISLSPAPDETSNCCIMEVSPATIVSTAPDFLPEPTADSTLPPSQTPAQTPEPSPNPIRRFFSSLRRKLGA